MCSQELHLIGQNATIAQDKVFPQRGHIRGVQKRHARLLGGATAFSVVARPASGHHIHPSIHPLLRKGNDVLSGQVQLTEQATAIGTDVSVSGKEFAVGQPRLQRKGADVGHTTGADDAVDLDDGLKTRSSVVSASKDRNLCARLPSHIMGCVVNHRLL